MSTSSILSDKLASPVSILSASLVPSASIFSTNLS
jgi:hypothetical protein